MSQVARFLVLFLLCVAFGGTSLAAEQAANATPKIGAEVTAGLAHSTHVTVVVMLRAPLETRVADPHQYRSSVATGNGAVAPQGGAPDAAVVVVRVLDSHGAFYSSSDIVAALDWIATNHPDVRVVNMSVGTNELFSTVCDNTYSWTMALHQAVAAVAANGTVLTASSGNQGSATSISAPACISGVIGVGAVWDASMGSQTFLGCTDSTTAANKPTCFTNSNALVELYAPGAYTTATGAAIDQYTTNHASTYGGTSQAAPLVAACIADLFQLKPTLGAAQINSALMSSSTRVTDPKNGLSFPSLDCDQALVHVDRIFADGLEADI